MTIRKLITKLAQKNQKEMNQGKEPNGAFGVLETWYENINKLDSKIKNIEDFEYCYNNIHGMIWGLRAVFFITDEEKYQLMEELLQIHKNFYSIEED